MDKVLIVDKNAEDVLSLKFGLEKMQQFKVEVAVSGKEAIELIGKNNFSVFVTGVALLDMDALDLLSFMTQNRPNAPCIVLSDQGKPWFKKKPAGQSFLYLLEKPFKINSLASAIFVGLNLRDEGKNLEGMTLASLLPLMELLKKTCRMEIASKGKGKGYLYFKDGVIIDGHYQKLNGEQSAEEIMTWDRIAIRLTDLPAYRTRARIKTRLMDMADASWKKNT